jgi:hypothetical protein
LVFVQGTGVQIKEGLKMWRAAMLAAATSLAALVMTLPAGATGSQTYTDPTGDSGTAADLTSVIVSNDDAGLLTIALKFANRTALTADDVFIVAFDTDKNARTGSQAGTEYIIGVDGSDQSFGLGKWNGTTFDGNVPQDTLKTSDGMTFQINRSELGNPNAFDFYVVALSNSSEASDDGPDGSAVWSYDLKFTPKIKSVAAAFAPAKPKAGKRFAVGATRVGLVTGETVAPSTKRCTAKLAGKALKPAGNCAWLIPKTAKGKRVVVTITVSYGGSAAVSASYAFKVT